MKEHIISARLDMNIQFVGMMDGLPRNLTISEYSEQK